MEEDLWIRNQAPGDPRRPPAHLLVLVVPAGKDPAVLDDLAIPRSPRIPHGAKIVWTPAEDPSDPNE